MSEPTNGMDKDIEKVVWNATNQLNVSHQSTYVRRLLPTALKLVLVVPVLVLLIQVLRWWSGESTNPLFSVWTWGIVGCILPAAWAFYRLATWKSPVQRQQAIRAIDDSLGSSERIATADDFLQHEQRDGFMQAAVDDASEWARKGSDAKLDRPINQRHPASVWWPVPVAIMILLLANLISGFTRTLPAATAPKLAAAAVPADTTQIAKENERETPETQVEPPAVTKANPRVPREPRTTKPVNRQGDANAMIPDSAQESEGKLDEGETRESQQSANPSSAQGSPSTSGQPSKASEKAKKKEAKPKKKKPKAKERKPKPKNQDEKPSGATAGQGSSKGSDNNAAPSDWSSMSQAATPEDEDNEEEDEVDDEEEEQDSRGGVQPNLRDRRAPVNRDLQIGFGSNRPNPDANGRGGPGGQKKSRGVASLVLGVPIPDRVNGQPNKGRVRITQQRITPEAEQNDAVNAQDRMARQSPIGPLHHPEFSPWLQDYVRRYFLNRRAKYPLKTSPEASPNPAAKNTMQTTRISQSDTPQS